MISNVELKSLNKYDENYELSSLLMYLNLTNTIGIKRSDYINGFTGEYQISNFYKNSFHESFNEIINELFRNISISPFDKEFYSSLIEDALDNLFEYYDQTYVTINDYSFIYDMITSPYKVKYNRGETLSHCLSRQLHIMESFEQCRIEFYYHHDIHNSIIDLKRSYSDRYNKTFRFLQTENLITDSTNKLSVEFSFMNRACETR